MVGEEARDSYVGVADADQEEVRAVGGLDVVTPEVEGDVAGCRGADGFGVGVDVGGGVLDIVSTVKTIGKASGLHRYLSDVLGY